MMTISKLPRFYVYLQHPHTGDWVTVGRWELLEADTRGTFRYAPSYLASGATLAIDPVNLPNVVDTRYVSHRYQGLHDVLRDASPDAWGRLVLQHKHGFVDGTPDYKYLLASSNGDRWGALAVGTQPKPSPANLNSPRLPQLDLLTEELLAIHERRAPVSASLRRTLLNSAGLGGARPKTTLHDGTTFWLIKPHLSSDTLDVPRLEHAAMTWGHAAGMNFAQSRHHQVKGGLSVVAVKRFDRVDTRRVMTLSAASLLSTEYPNGHERALWSYPLLAQMLIRIGAPKEDAMELFDRMVFNAIVGNDDDHPRNHAAIYGAADKRWRLSPAFDVVPEPSDETPGFLSMQLSLGRFDISRDAVLANCEQFGHKDRRAAAVHLDALLARIEAAFPRELDLPGELETLLRNRLATGLARLSAAK
ncbi:type II toxin-antitoxin system HipA family toxin [Bordetella genomosp. 13]|uniref:type II toxin-antitoxin system HipA family toxin n=1 Tax=Bordetella genomosp. 13 TaxID=463040 RepID=UPI0021B53982|nr:HipA domain-containing protein [Bordetella genomosp. 13]